MPRNAVEEIQMATYLVETPFSDKKYYSIEINDDAGVVVYSECCADTMSVDVAREVHAALGQYLAALDA
jgi:hypothetical protein